MNMNMSLGNYNIIDNHGIQKSIENVLKSNVDFNVYAPENGILSLREKIGEFASKNLNCVIDIEQVLVTSGSQQSLNIVAQTLLSEGDFVLIEQPTYYGVIDVFKKRKVNLVGVNVNEEGIDLEMLENQIKKYSPKLIYVVPTFNNPTGYAWSNENREKFLEIVNKYNIIVVEDDPYSLINFKPNDYESLFKMNGGKNVVYLGTFSKLISPAINVGYIITKKDYKTKFKDYKKSFDLCTNAFLQYVVLDYLTANNLQEKVGEKIEVYKRLVKKNMQDLKRKYGDKIEFMSSPKGGLFFLVKFKEKVNTRFFDNGNKYYIEPHHENFTRINICAYLKNKKSRQ